jgi:hypothetical protein
LLGTACASPNINPNHLDPAVLIWEGVTIICSTPVASNTFSHIEGMTLV